MIDFIIAHSDAIITGILGVVGAIITAIASVYVTKRKVQGEENKSLQLENKKLQEELSQLKDITAIDNALDKTHGSIYYETMFDGSKRSLCGFCWELSHKRIPLKTQNSYIHPQRLVGHCEVCKATCNDKLEPQYDYSATENKRTII